MIVPAHIQRICDEFSVEVIEPNRYPGVGQTRAVGALTNIAATHGEGHLRLVMSTLAETENNRKSIDQVTLWCISHLLRAYPHLVEREFGRWLECFDAMPFDELAAMTNTTLRGRVKLPHALAGAVNERIYRFFGPNALEPDLFDERRGHHD